MNILAEARQALSSLLKVEQDALEAKKALEPVALKEFLNRDTVRSLQKQGRKCSLHPSAPKASQNYRHGPGYPAMLRKFAENIARANNTAIAPSIWRT